jgi:hypothetical protein
LILHKDKVAAGCHYPILGIISFHSAQQITYKPVEIQQSLPVGRVVHEFSFSFCFYKTRFAQNGKML